MFDKLAVQVYLALAPTTPPPPTTATTFDFSKIPHKADFNIFAFAGTWIGNIFAGLSAIAILVGMVGFIASYPIRVFAPKDSKAYGRSAEMKSGGIASFILGIVGVAASEIFFNTLTKIFS